MASLAMPKSPQYALRWAEFIHSAQGVLRAACKRVLSYHITDVEIAGDRLGDDEKEKYEEFLSGPFDVLRCLHEVGGDAIIYGSSFTSVVSTFRRRLRCPKCFSEWPLSTVRDYTDFHFEWTNFAFHATCPACHFRGDWGKPVDQRAGPDGIRIKRWNPHEIEINWDTISGDTEFFWRIPPDYANQIRMGRPWQLERCPWEIVQAIKANRYFRFGKDAVFHIYESAPAGIRNRGWGIPSAIANFRQAWYCQILHRFNEAIALDYVIPFRVITPAPRGGDPASADPVLSTSLGSFTSRVMSMLRRRRKDPAAWNVCPVPLQYQALGGEAKNLVPKDLLDQGLEILLNNSLVPVELYKGSLSIKADPMGLRLFESMWTHLVHQLNAWLGFLAGKLADMLSWEPAELRLTPVTFADDLEKAQARLQLAMGNQISKTTAFKPLDIEYRDEIRKMLEEQLVQAEEQAKFEDPAAFESAHRDEPRARQAHESCLSCHQKSHRRSR
jgi:hypothetical protein